MRRFLSLVICLLILNAAAAPSMAASYTYTVRIFGGNQGAIDGEEAVEITGLHYGDRITFRNNTVTVESTGESHKVTVQDNTKYSIRGLRESGKDNNTVRASFTVSRDQDYVIAYSMRGASVGYIVHYVDLNGVALANSEMYYGSVGDKPVVAYQYIEGYIPQAYNINRTLSENVGENVFIFVYRPIAGATEPTPTAAATATPSPTESPQPTESPEPTETPSGEEQDDSTSDEPAEPEEDTEQGDDADEPGAGDERQDRENTPPELIIWNAGEYTGLGGDISLPFDFESEEILDYDLPLAGFDQAYFDEKVQGLETGEGASRGLTPLQVAGFTAGGVVILAGLAWLLFFLLGKKKKDEEDEEQQEQEPDDTDDV